MTDRIDLKIDTNKFQDKMRNLTEVRDRVMPDLYRKFVESTPRAVVKGGNAREHTTYHANMIQANYPYASVLNDGRSFRDGQMRGSEQAPHGMVEPTREFAMKIIPQVVRRLGK